MDTPVRTCEFDHRPSDDELAVVFSWRPHLYGNRFRDAGDEIRIETALFPTRAACAWVVLTMPAIYVVAQMTSTIDPRMIVPGVILSVMVVAGLYALGKWFNRLATAANPLVAFDRRTQTLHIEGRAEPLPVADVVELVVWELTHGNLRAIGRNRDDDPVCQVMALAGRDDRFRLEFLYQHGGPVEGIGSYSPRRLAAVMNVPLRAVRNRKQLSDLRPPDQPKTWFGKKPA
jgi:hypothetical protein